MDFESWLRDQLSSAPLPPGAAVAARPAVAPRPLRLRPRGLQLLIALVAVLLAVAGMIGAQRAGALEGRMLLPSHPQGLPISTWTGTEAKPAGAASPKSDDAPGHGSGSSTDAGSRGPGAHHPTATTPSQDDGHGGGGSPEPGPGGGGVPTAGPSTVASPDDGGHRGGGGDPSPSSHGGRD